MPALLQVGCGLSPHGFEWFARIALRPSASIVGGDERSSAGRGDRRRSPDCARWRPELSTKNKRALGASRTSRRGSSASAGSDASTRSAGVALGALAVVAVAIALSSSGGGSSGLKNGNRQATLVAQVERLLGGIPQSGATLGNASAPVTMTYYSDLQCPVCAEFTLRSGFPELVARDVRAGTVKIVYRALETATRDPRTSQAHRIAAFAAGRQKHFWDYVQTLLPPARHRGHELRHRDLPQWGRTAGPALNLDAWRSARNDSSLIAELHPTGIRDHGRGSGDADADLRRSARDSADAWTVPSYGQLQQAIKSVPDGPHRRGDPASSGRRPKFARAAARRPLAGSSAEIPRYTSVPASAASSGAPKWWSTAGIAASTTPNPPGSNGTPDARIPRRRRVARRPRRG